MKKQQEVIKSHGWNLTAGEWPGFNAVHAVRQSVLIFLFCKTVCIGKMTRRGHSTLTKKYTSNQDGGKDLVCKKCVISVLDVDEDL